MRDIEFLLLEGVRAGQFGGSLEPHGEHAMGFVAFLAPETPFTGHVIDLGSGAGLPAIPLADAHPQTTWSLIERRTSRAEMLERAVRRLGFAERVEVIARDAGEVAWGRLRGTADWVTARAFGPPAATAEVAGPLLRQGGSLLVSEPREQSEAERWPARQVARCGLAMVEGWETDAGRYARLVRTEADVDDLPRRGARKRPLF